MKARFLRTAPLSFVVFCCLIGADGFAASLDPVLPKARQEAEAAGYTFLTSHDEIVAAAKTEGKLRVLGSFEAATYKAVINAFRKHYPFIDVQVVEMTGTADPAAARRVAVSVGGVTPPLPPPPARGSSAVAGAARMNRRANARRIIGPASR